MTPGTVAVIGAGMAGIAAARVLRAAGVPVRLFDKSPRVGGRMATRVVGVPGVGQAVFDHGCQSLWAVGPEFELLLDTLTAAGELRVWADTLPGVSGRGPYYAGVRGMRPIIELLARGLDIEHRPVASVGYAAGGGYAVEFPAENGQEVPPFAAVGVILTPPVPQSVALLDAGEIRVPNRSSLTGVAYDRRLAYLAVLAGIEPADAAGLYPAAGDVRWAVDNAAKGISPVGPALTLHAAEGFTDVTWGAPVADVRPYLFPPGAAWADGRELYAAVHRWRYAMTTVTNPAPFAQVAARLFLAGDGFGPLGNAEGAFDSGRAAARHLLATF